MWAPENAAMDAPKIEQISDPQALLAQIIECIQQEDTMGVKTYILEHKLKEDSIFWELILKLGHCITSEMNERNPAFFDVCNRCLLYLIRVGNPKETLLALLEQLDTWIDDIKFKSFLPLVEMSLQKMPKKLFHSLDITLETVSSHLRSIQLPQNSQLEGEEIKLFHLDKSVVRLADILMVYLKLLETFVKKIDLKAENLSEATKQEALVLKKHLIKVFDHPLCHLVLTYDPQTDKAESDSRLCAELAMRLLTKVETDFHRLIRNAQIQTQEEEKRKDKDGFIKIEKQREKEEDMEQEEIDNQENEMKQAALGKEDEKVTDFVEAWDFKMEVTPLAQACLTYLIHVEHLGKEKFPSVYSHNYMLEFHLNLLSLLLQNTSYPVNYKGLLLCRTLTNLLSKGSIPSDSLDNPGYTAVINDLIHIMIKCPVRDHRAVATQVFPAFISKFDDGGRYQVYLNVLSSCSHSGLKGYLITIFKNDIAENLNKVKAAQAVARNADNSKGSVSTTLPENFNGKRLEKLMKLALKLPEKETSDMLENSDQIISALNFLRFLVLADVPSSNLTGFWDFMDDIEKDFLSPLRLGLDLSKAHYNMELDNIRQGKDLGGAGPETTVSVTGMNLPAMEQKEKLELVERALNTHHVMQSLVARVSELVDQQKNS